MTHLPPYITMGGTLYWLHEFQEQCSLENRPGASTSFVPGLPQLLTYALRVKSRKVTDPFNENVQTRGAGDVAPPVLSSEGRDRL